MVRLRCFPGLAEGNSDSWKTKMAPRWPISHCWITKKTTDHKIDLVSHGCHYSNTSYMYVIYSYIYIYTIIHIIIAWNIPFCIPFLVQSFFFLYIWGLKPMKKIGSKTDLPMSPLVKSLKSWGLFPWPKTGFPVFQAKWRPQTRRRRGDGDQPQVKSDAMVFRFHHHLYHTISYYIILYTSYYIYIYIIYIILSHTIPYYTILYHNIASIPYYTILYHNISYYIYHTIYISYYIYIYHTISYYTILYHTIPYFIII